MFKPWDNRCMDKGTVLVLGGILVMVVAGFAFLIFNPSAHKAMQQNIESMVQESAPKPKP